MKLQLQALSKVRRPHRRQWRIGPNITPATPYCESELEPGHAKSEMEETYGSSIEFPVIADKNLYVSKLYNMLPADTVVEGPRSAADNATVRTVYIISPDLKIKMMMSYPMTTGRDVEELLRVVDSIHITSGHKVATPVNWRAGQDVIIAASVSDDEAKELFPEGWKSVNAYTRVVEQPKKS